MLGQRALLHNLKEEREKRRALIKLPAIIAKRRQVSSNERDHNDITIIEKMDHNENNNDDQIINHKKHGCNKKKQDIDEDIHDYICPINLELMLEPVKLPCSHYLCKTSCDRLLRMKKEHRKCPLCRANIPKTFNAENIDIKMCKKIKKFFPNEVKELQQIQKELKEFALPKLRIKYGNHYSKVRNAKKTKNKKHINEHRWDAYVLFCDPTNKDSRITDTSFIKDVTMNFSAYVKTKWGKRYFNGKRSKGIFSTVGIGWGYFDFDIKIRFTDRMKLPDLDFTHELCFERGGDEHEIDLDLTDFQAYYAGLIDREKYQKHVNKDIIEKKTSSTLKNKKKKIVKKKKAFT